MAHTRSIVCGVVPLLLTCGLVACIGPAGGPQSAPGAGPGAAAATSAPSVDGKGKGIVWNGEGVGASAKSWTGCKKEDATCKTSLGMVPSVGHDGSTGLRFHAEGSDFQGGGWNWFGWWPENAGSDVSGFKNLSFWFKAELKSPAEGPDPASLAVLLGCSAGKAESESAILSKYDAKLLDGAWHEIVIPLADLLKGKGAAFDPHSAWEFRIASWSADPKNFNLYFDDIGFDNR